MQLTRRDFVMLGLVGTGALIAGCQNASIGGPQFTDRPHPEWPDLLDRPDATGRGTAIGGTQAPTPRLTEAPGGPIIGTGPDSLYAPVTGPLEAIPRSRWAMAAPILSRIVPMGKIEFITVHHEGWTPVYFEDYASTARRLEEIRRSHLQRLHAGDIGYHFIIDRAGRLWQGRDLVYQGAHVHDHNPHNIGVMCLGNFDLQSPSEAQYATLKPVLARLMTYYGVPLHYVYTHQELNPTECPGKIMQAHMVTLRRAGIV